MIRPHSSRCSGGLYSSQSICSHMHKYRAHIKQKKRMCNNSECATTARKNISCRKMVVKFQLTSSTSRSTNFGTSLSSAPIKRSNISSGVGVATAAGGFLSSPAVGEWIKGTTGSAQLPHLSSSPR